MILLDEPAEAYHANHAIGSGDVRAFIRSPQLYADTRSGIFPRETPAMLFGTASHLALLQPDLFRKDCVRKPDGMNFATKEGKAWRDEQAGRIIVPFDKWAALERMHERMPTEIRAIMGKCDREVTVRRELDGLQVQCRFDLWSKDRSAAYDLKSVASIESAERSIWKLRYDVQERWYTLLGQLEVGKRPSFRFIFTETSPPHRWRIVELDLDYKMTADADLDRAFIGIRERIKSGDWSDPEDIHEMVSPPKWLADDEETEGEEE